MLLALSAIPHRERAARADTSTANTAPTGAPNQDNDCPRRSLIAERIVESVAAATRTRCGRDPYDGNFPR